MIEKQYPSTVQPLTPRALFIARAIAAFVVTMTIVYFGYWLSKISFLPPVRDPFSEALTEIERAALKARFGEGLNIYMTVTGNSHDSVCSFCTFGAIRTNCRRISFTIPYFKESDRPRVREMALYLAEKMSQPCQNLNLLAENRREAVAAEVGCGKKHFKYTLYVEAISVEFIQSPGGGGSYKNSHILAVQSKGEI